MEMRELPVNAWELVVNAWELVVNARELVQPLCRNYQSTQRNSSMLGQLHAQD